MSSGYTTGYTVPYTGNQALLRHKELIAKEMAIMKHHERVTNVRMKLKAPLQDVTLEELAMARSVYGVRLCPRPERLGAYDRIFKSPPDYDQRVKRESDRYLMKYKINARLDDDNREIPVLTSSEMGHRLHSPPEQFSRQHARVQAFHKDLYRANGISFH